MLPNDLFSLAGETRKLVSQRAHLLAELRYLLRFDGMPFEQCPTRCDLLSFADIFLFLAEAPTRCLCLQSVLIKLGDREMNLCRITARNHRIFKLVFQLRSICQQRFWPLFDLLDKGTELGRGFADARPSSRKLCRLGTFIISSFRGMCGAGQLVQGKI